MIKSLLLPAILAIVVSLAGSAGYSVMKARAAHAVFVVEQDSIALLQADSAAHETDGADGASHDDAADGQADLGEPAEGALLLEHATTPADSIRALIAEREQRTGAAAADSHSDAAPATLGKSTGASAGGSKGASKGADASHAAEPSGHDAKSADAKSADTAATHAAVTPPKPVKSADPVADVLPERRLAKIFGAMSARDAAKVLEQMTDSDIRTILSMMGDRQAAAVLTAMPATRAATISRGSAKSPEGVTP